MKLTLKFGLAFLIGLSAVIAVYAWATLRRETDQFWADMRRDNLLTGRAMAAAIQQLRAKSEHEEAAVDQLLRRASAVETPVRVSWLPFDALAETPLRDVLDSSQRDELSHGGEVVVVTSARGKVAGELLTFVPIVESQGAVEVAEPLTEVNRYTRETLDRLAAMSGAVIVVCGALFALIGTRLVGRPVGQLIEGFRHVAAGDLAHRPKVAQHDELGVLAREFGDLCNALAEAHRRANEESAKRLEALEQLRHADRLRTVGQLTAGVAHELGTPLNVVWARASMIARGESIGAEARSCAAIIEDQSQRMTRMIRKLLEFTRPRTPQKTRANLQQVLRQTVEVLAAEARKRNVSIVIRPPEGAVDADVDAGQLQQVLSNLLLNAIQAMPSGGTATVGVRTEHVRPPADVGGEPDDYFCLFVQDQGVGISATDLSRIFEPFFTTKDVGEGTGLGLSISRGIILEHGGWIGVASRPGEGARFSVYLPRGEHACAGES